MGRESPAPGPPGEQTPPGAHRARGRAGSQGAGEAGQPAVPTFQGPVGRSEGAVVEFGLEGAGGHRSECQSGAPCCSPTGRADVGTAAGRLCSTPWMVGGTGCGGEELGVGTRPGEKAAVRGLLRYPRTLFPSP